MALLLRGEDERHKPVSVIPEKIIREGQKAEEIVKLIEEERDSGTLVLGAPSDPSGRFRASRGNASIVTP
ncbi:MAG TPA: hypothetical protein VE986_01465 [Hyphomicrobiales bacterium]|nr:hypothetical protein [Hyphomicrobiales bacterium]